MKPATRDLVGGIIEELRQDIVPMAAGDPWLASRLRSVVALLTHVALRLEHEADILSSSNAALRAVLAECERLVPDLLPPPDLARATGEVADDRLTERLDDENEALRARLEGLLRALWNNRSAAGLAAYDAAVAALRADAERERVLYEPFTRMATY